jgi:hypothetical protein
VPLQRVNTLINAKRAVTADTALLLSEIFGTSPEFWMNLQAQRDLFAAKRWRGKKPQRRSVTRAGRRRRSCALRSCFHPPVKNPSDTGSFPRCAPEWRNLEPRCERRRTGTCIEHLRFRIECESRHA